MVIFTAQDSLKVRMKKCDQTGGTFHEPPRVLEGRRLYKASKVLVN
jgi:hypothetical protein